MRNNKSRTNNTFVVLGIDPGTATMGYGIVQNGGAHVKCLGYGAISTPAGLEPQIRLNDIYKRLTELLARYKPNVVAVEDIFYAKNQKTIIQVAAARGIALLAAAQSHKRVYSFTPLQVKQAVTGYGRADKKQVQQMVKTLLKLEEQPEPDDAADALAVAICCAHSLNSLITIGRQ